MPDRIYTYQFLNTIQGNYIIPTPYIDQGNILSVDRDGIGIQSSEGNNDDQIVLMTNQYHHWSMTDSVTEPYDTYFIKYFESGTTNKSAIFTIGSTAIVGHIYKMYIDGYFITYTLGSFEPTEYVIDSFINQINFGSFGFSIVASKIDASSLLVTYPDGRVILPYHIFGTKYLFQTGAYVKTNGKYFLLYNATSYTWYPNYSNINSTYHIPNLTQLLYGVLPYVANPGYNLIDYKEETAGNAIFTGTESSIPTVPGTYKYDMDSQKMTFAEPLNEGEYIKILYL